MKENRLAENYFNRLGDLANCKEEDLISGARYCFKDGDKNSKIRRFILDDNVDVALSKIRSRRIWDLDYIDGSDLLIIGYSLAGTETLGYKGRTRLERGQVFYLRPDEDFSLEMDKHDGLYYLLDLSQFRDLLQCRRRDSGCGKENCTSYIDNICRPGQLVVEDASYANKAYREDIKTIKSSKVYNFLDYTRLKGQLFDYLNYFLRIRLAGRKGVNKKRYGSCQVVKAKKIIKDRPEEQISVGELADIMDISCYKLQNAFKRVEGTTVYNYMLREKMDYAKELLEETDLPIIDIAFKLGYENPSKFSSAFKRITLQTPSEYRRNPKN